MALRIAYQAVHGGESYPAVQCIAVRQCSTTHNLQHCLQQSCTSGQRTWHRPAIWRKEAVLTAAHHLSAYPQAHSVKTRLIAPQRLDLPHSFETALQGPSMLDLPCSRSAAASHLHGQSRVVSSEKRVGKGEGMLKHAAISNRAHHKRRCCTRAHEQIIA